MRMMSNMLLKDYFAPEEFLAEFKKRFDAFCKNSPVILTYRVTPISVYLQRTLDTGEIDIHKYDFDYNMTVKENISNIKSWLRDNWYPRVGIYIIDRTVIKKDQMVLVGPDGTQEIYELKGIPITVFLRRVRSKGSEEAKSLFLKHAQLLFTMEAKNENTIHAEKN